MAIRVIGAGLARTGTMSTKVALQQLGFDKCYHMIDLLSNPQNVHYWEAAQRGEKVNWDEVFEGYQATVDYPGCRYYKQYMELYPDAKVLLNVRDPDKWYESTRDTIYEVAHRVFGPDGNQSNSPGFPGDKELLHRVMKMVKKDMWENDFKGRFAEDRQLAIDFFNRHNDEVKATVPADKLLVFEVKQGWEPLCKFLGVPVPDTEFPRLNDREAFMARINNASLAK